MVFYDFCRAVDDIADDSSILVRSGKVHACSIAGKLPQLDRRESVRPACSRSDRKYRLDATLLIEIIRAEFEMDIDPQTLRNLRGPAALTVGASPGAVGLVSIEIFGCRSPLSKTYAENLGAGLCNSPTSCAMSAEDAPMDRIYLSAGGSGDAFGVTLPICSRANLNPASPTLMRFEGQRVEDLFQKTARNLAAGRCPRAAVRRNHARFYEKLCAHAGG